MISVSAVLNPNRSTVEEWSVKLDAEIVGPAVAGEDGTLYIPTDEALIAMDPENAEVKWEVAHQGARYMSPPALTSDTVYVTGGVEGEPLKALRPENGGERWHKAKDELSSTGSPLAITPQGVAYAEEWPGRFCFLDHEGNPQWSYELDPVRAGRGGFGAAPDGTIYHVGGNVTAVREGHKVWAKEFPTGEGIHAGTKLAFTSANEVLYTTDSGKLRKLDPQGEIDWEFSGMFGRRVDELTAEEQKQALRGGFSLTSSPVLAPDESAIYAGGWDGRLYSLDVEGRPNWIKTLPLQIAHSGVQIGPDGTIYLVGDQEGSVYALEPERGDLLWKYTSKEQNCPSNITISGDRVILTTHNGGLHALSKEGLMRALKREPQEPDAPPPVIDIGDGFITIGDTLLGIRED